jgi:hypothetical protein
MHERRAERFNVLGFLYIERSNDPHGATSLARIMKEFEDPGFALSVLREQDLIDGNSDDGYSITADGCEMVEDPWRGLGDLRDATYYRYLRSRFCGADFDSKLCTDDGVVLCFSWTGSVSANLDESIESAMKRENMVTIGRF